MSAISVTLPINPAEQQTIDIDITINGIKQKLHYCVEIVPWETCDDAPRVECLRQKIQTYEHDWELLNIGVATDNTVQLMFKQRSPLQADAQEHAEAA